MKKQTGSGKRVQSAEDYVKRCQEECLEAHVEGEATLKLLGLWHGALETKQLAMGATRKFRKMVKVAYQRWEQLEVDAALSRLNIPLNSRRTPRHAFTPATLRAYKDRNR